jgi:putative glutamine amidotransferase
LLPVAHAADGLVEAFEVKAARSFAVAMQWHPEWRTSENPFYAAIFAAFGDACRQRNEARTNTRI